MSTSDWHVTEEDLRSYAAGELHAPALWSADTHLVICAHCRERLATFVDPETVESGWQRLDAVLDAPRRGFLEAALVRLGMPDHQARLLAATPSLRSSWLISLVVTLAMAVAATHAAHTMRTPLLFLAVAPFLPIAGVAVSFGPGIDPTYEMMLVSPMRSFRLLMLRAVAVLATTTLLSGLASLTMPTFGLVTIGWLLPALALTGTSLALMSRVGPAPAAIVTGAGWLAALTYTSSWQVGESTLFTAAAQAVFGVAAVVAGIASISARHRYDSSHRFDLAFFPRTRSH